MGSAYVFRTVRPAKWQARTRSEVRVLLLNQSARKGATRFALMEVRLPKVADLGRSRIRLPADTLVFSNHF